MLYEVTLELYELVKADSPEEAKQKFRDDFDWSDINYGTYTVKPDTRKVPENA